MYIHCEYCGTQFNSKHGKCPNCGAEIASNADLNDQKDMDKKIAAEIEQAYHEATRLKWEEFDRTHPYVPRVSPERQERAKWLAVATVILFILFAVLFTVIFTHVTNTTLT